MVLSLDEGTADASAAALPAVLADVEPIHAGAEMEGVDMLYSSGTTGRPKGVIPDQPGRPFGAPSRAADDMRAIYGIGESTVHLVATPFYRIVALATAMMTQRCGGTVVVMDRFDPQGFLTCVQDFDVTHSNVVPTILSRLLEHRDSTGDSYDLSSLRFLGHGGAPVRLASRNRRWSGSDSSSTTVGAPRSVRGSASSRLWDGMIARSPQGWCSVGDLGDLDEEGYLYLTDRAAFIIITGGENMYPVEVENALIAHPDIRDAAVVGHEDPDLGQRVVAFVEPIRPVENEVAWVESVNRRLREHLAGYKCPREIRLVDQLPRTPTGKVMKRDLL
ncbi:AMP-binding protein [Nocardioides sp. NPDC006273]|uniref:AMP-binding protein n=1 Tax=Nocardioides sp. NPDC006273 TaxID=3155598 RepID=UPI0033B71141